MTIAPVEVRIQAACMLILTALALSAALYTFSPVLLPFVIAILLTYCLAPFIDLQVRHLRLPRGVALVTTILLASVLLFLVGMVVSAAAGEVGSHVDEYQAQIRQMLERIAASPLLERFGLESAGISGTLLGELSKSAGGAVRATVSGVMSIVSNGMLVLIFTLFMLGGRTRKAVRGSVLQEIESRTKRYVTTMVGISTFTGILVGATLAVLGVPFAWMFGFLAFLLNFIPNLGSFIATALPVPVVLLSPELSVPARIAAIAIPAAIQFVVGSLLQPKIMGKSLDLHPVTVLMALIFFGIIWGIVGMFLATPLVAIVKILLERFEYTRTIGALLGGELGRMAESPPSAAGASAGAGAGAA